MKVSQKSSFYREPRYILPDDIIVMVRPFGMKFYTFEMGALNASISGALLVSRNRAFIPFEMGNKLNCTFDFTHKILTRPIHFIGLVVRKTEERDEQNDLKQFFGIKIESMEHNFYEMFTECIKTLPMAELDRERLLT